MGTEQLRALLELLREHGVTEYSADGVTLKLGGSISVVKHTPDGTVAVPPDSMTPEQLEKLNRTRALFGKLPAEYQQMFRVGDP